MQQIKRDDNNAVVEPMIAGGHSSSQSVAGCAVVF